MKVNNRKLFYLFLWFQPFFDLTTALMTRFDIGTISLGIVVRGIFILLMCIYLFFFCDSKYKKKSTIYMFLLIVYGVVYFALKSELLFNKSFLINDVVYLFKYFYFLILFITGINYFDQYKVSFNRLAKLFVSIALVYSILILIPTITKTGFSSYMINTGEGVVGWFYAANDISIILALLYPFILYSFNDNFNLKNIISIILVVVSCFLLGTKSAFLGVIVGSVLFFVYCLFSFKKKYKHIIFLILLLFSILLFSSNSFVLSNINLRVDKYEEFQETGTNIVHDETEITVKEGETEVSVVVLSSRDRMLKSTYKIFKKQNFINKLFGIGFSNRKKINDVKIEKLVEMDLFDIVFHGGIIFLILYLIPFIFVFIELIKYIKCNSFKFNFEQLLLGYICGIGFCIAFVCGHLFSSPSSVIYYGCSLILFLQGISSNDKILNKKKLSFLMLHLSHGGIEKATVGVANSLCDKYDVELVVDYKNNDEVVYDIDKRINVKFLIDNDVAFRVLKYKDMIKRRKFKLLFVTLKNDYKFNIFAILKDIYMSVVVTKMKTSKMIEYILDSDSSIIISTREEFSVLLSKYGNCNVNKIAVEHRHHNNDKKYINSIRYNYDNINYLVVLTDGLNKDYSSFLRKNSKTKVVTIPNMVDFYPKKLSSLDNKKIISIGRIVEGKKIDEIVEIASKVKYKDWEFCIIGDGNKFDEICNLIKEKNIKNIKMLGYMNNQDCLKELSKSSIFIMTSVTEGLPMVLLESFSYGVPAVCYRTDSGVADIVDDSINGYVIDDRDESKMISCLEELMSNKKLRKEYGKKAREKSLQFNEDEIRSKWLKILK